MSASICKGCGREIVWAKTNHGKSVPLDSKALVFSVLQQGNELIAVKPSGGPIGERFMVSHFATCPAAAEFSGRNRDTVPASQSPFTMAPDRHYSEPKDID